MPPFATTRSARGCHPCLRYVVLPMCGPDKAEGGGDGGIRTLDRALQPYNGLANRRLQPLGHSSVTADMPEAAASRKRADLGPAHSTSFSDVRTPYLGPKRIRAAESQSWPWAACASRTRDSGNARFPDFIDIM